MKMREVTDGLTIPPHGTVTLAPSGYHLMFVNLKQPLEQGRSGQSDADLREGGLTPVAFEVRGIGAAAPKGDAMPGMKM